MVLLAFELGACGGQTTAEGARDTQPHDASPEHASAADSGAIGFPVGTYTQCASGLHAADGNLFLNTIGFMSGATLTLVENGTTLTATYTDDNGEKGSFDFSQTTNSSATLAHAGQLDGGFTGICVLGVGVQNEQFYPADLNASAGALTYDAGTLFFSLQGLLQGDGSSCGLQSSKASFWLICQNSASAESVETKAPDPVLQWPAGNYTCSAQLATHYASDGMNQIVASGSDGGKLLLTQIGAVVTAEYSGDWSVSGTLHFDTTTATTANAEPAEKLTTPCLVPIGAGTPPPQTPEMLPIAAGSLMLNDSTLFVSFAGTMAASSSCSGASKAGSLICSKQ